MQGNKIELGKLEKVDLRNIWTSESEHFMPWLAQEDNLKLLGDAIGIELELEAQEKNVGPFRADILCKDTATDHWVLIENQLEKTDHVHLGQLLTYASGLKAVTIVWIARKFTEEHRAALDWLNEITDDHFNFFGLEVELWRIGNSIVAPKFNIASKPNDWSKTVAVGATQVRNMVLTDSKVLQRDFWAAFTDYVKEHNSNIKTTKPLPQNWMNIAIGRSGMSLCAVASLWDSAAESFSSHELRAELVLNDNNSKKYFEQLEAEKEVIEKEIGEQLTWHNPP
ncbi:MAG: DUF4268 domain-containing protein, partial [Desulfobacterales bacterium]|nr:DUF4268 domain-containing protein [Desulfobacterales bacterium]